MKLTFLILLILGNFQLHANINGIQVIDFITVGADGCNYTSLQPAIDSILPGQSSVIRVVDQVYHENLILDDVNVDIIGGYVDCQAAIDNNQNGDSFTVNAEDPTESVVTFSGNQPSIVYLENMNVTGGYAGIYSDGSNIELTMKNMSVLDNFAMGVGIDEGGHMIIIDDTIIAGNYGPAINCAYESNTINIKGNSQFVENISNSGGGALLVSHGCQVDGYKPTIIGNNHAYNGGGVFAYLGGIVNLYGVTIKDNTANSGGGVVASAGGHVNLHGVTIKGNDAAHGSAFYVYGENTTLTLTQSMILENANQIGTSSTGAAMYGATVDIENSMIVDNMINNNTLLAGYEATLNLKYVTLASNGELDGTIKFIENGSVNIKSSILQNDSVVLLSGDGSGSLSMSCTIIVTSGVDELFANPLIGDYHLTSNSPAIDYCTTPEDINPDYPVDIDGQARNAGQLDIEDNNLYDVGADAYYHNDSIFSDDFEGN